METEKNPWKLRSSTEKYDNPWIRVTEHEVINPGGGLGIYGVVHFKNLAIGVVPFENNMLWLVGQFRFPLNRYSWEIPEGGGKIGVNPMESAKRELKEETGLVAEHYEVIVRMDLSNSVSDEDAIVYLARELRLEEAAPEESEELRIRKISLEDAFEEVEKGVIRDSLTVAAIYKLVIMKKEGLL